MKRGVGLVICLSLIFVLIIGSFASASLFSLKLKPWVSEKLGFEKDKDAGKAITGNVIDDSAESESSSSESTSSYSDDDSSTSSYSSPSSSSTPSSESSSTTPSSAAPEFVLPVTPEADYVDASYLNKCFNQVGKKGSAYVIGEFKDESCEACMKDGSWKYACKSNQICVIGLNGRGRCVIEPELPSITPDGEFKDVKTPIPSQPKTVPDEADYVDASYLNDIPGAINPAVPDKDTFKYNPDGEVLRINPDGNYESYAKPLESIGNATAPKYGKSIGLDNELTLPNGDKMLYPAGYKPNLDNTGGIMLVNPKTGKGEPTSQYTDRDGNKWILPASYKPTAGLGGNKWMIHPETGGVLELSGGVIPDGSSLLPYLNKPVKQQGTFRNIWNQFKSLFGY